MTDFNKLMELVNDFGVESLRVGSYEARKALVGCDNWKLSMLRDKRQEARERVAKALWEVFSPQSPTAGAPNRMVDPTDEEIAAWADGFIRQNAYNRAVAVQIATEAAKWVRGRRVQVGWYYEMPVHERNGLRIKLSDAELAEFRKVAHVWPVYRTEREALPGIAGVDVPGEVGNG